MPIEPVSVKRMNTLFASILFARRSSFLAALAVAGAASRNSASRSVSVLMATRSVDAQACENPVGALRYAVRPEPSASFAWTYVRFSVWPDTVIHAAVNLRGLMTSLGAGGSLIAAALCAFAIVGGLLAVRDAVDSTAEANPGDVTVPSARQAARQTAAPGTPVAGGTPVAAVERRARPRPRRAPERRLPATGPVASPPASDAPQADDQPGTTGEGAGGGSAPAAPPPATGEAPRTVQGVVRQTREAVAPVVEAAPEPVQAPVNEVVDTVEDVAGAVDETLAPITGLLPR